MSDERLIISTKRAKGEDGYKTFSIRVKETLVERIDDISARSGHSRNELIGILLEYAVERCSVENDE